VNFEHDVIFALMPNRDKLGPNDFLEGHNEGLAYVNVGYGCEQLAVVRLHKRTRCAPSPICPCINNVVGDVRGIPSKKPERSDIVESRYHQYSWQSSPAPWWSWVVAVITPQSPMKTNVKSILRRSHGETISNSRHSSPEGTEIGHPLALCAGAITNFRLCNASNIAC
jgi:hypothetical protein